MLDLERFVSDCRAAIAGPSPDLAIKEILERAVSSRGEVEAALGTPRQGEVATVVPPHDHRMWALIGLYGVANPLRVLTGAIHIYGGDFFGTPRSECDPQTHAERPFDIERTRKLFADANARWLGARTPSGG